MAVMAIIHHCTYYTRYDPALGPWSPHQVWSLGGRVEKSKELVRNIPPDYLESHVKAVNISAECLHQILLLSLMIILDMTEETVCKTLLLCLCPLIRYLILQLVTLAVSVTIAQHCALAPHVSTLLSFSHPVYTQ